MLDKILAGVGAYKQRMPRTEDALLRRTILMSMHNAHFVHGRPLAGDFVRSSHIQVGVGCF